MAQPVTRMAAAQRGQVLVFIALVLTVVLLPLAAYAIDSATVTRAAAQLQAATAEAAMLGSQQIDQATLRSSGRVTIDGTAASNAAAGLLAVEAPSATVDALTVDGSRVTISTSELIRLPFNFLPETSIVIRANASARLAEGYDRPSSRLPLPTSTF
jgi:hypothetical protein